MTATIELNIGTATNILPCLKGRMNELESEKKAIESEMAALGTTIAEIEAKMANNTAVISTEKTNKRTRLPKGHGDILIETTLTNLPSETWVTMKQIEDVTGLNHATVYRTLVNNNGGRFIKKGGAWKIKRGNEQAQSTPLVETFIKIRERREQASKTNSK